ncbi:hypothetical protein Tsubulata_001071 [Turnera subulata]|uniref:BHLH domain-containing protein n=1 Tax=Turnera subulata TaxID=218843 RepID=A0A9Q0FMK7_9ROSI|nr:hypothetical protein Tsubulata_001071 [Turnera subulata]
MVKSSTRSPHDEEEDAEDYDSSSYKGEGVAVKGDGKSSEQKPNTHRSKHSETEQRRRSKINERQASKDSVVEYIQFLQEKLQMYEGAYPGWSQEPAKLIPWKNHLSSVEGLMDHSQVMKNGSAHDGVLASVQNAMESDIGGALIYRGADHSAASPPAVTFNTQMQSNAFASVERAGLPVHSLQESVPDAENMAYQLHSQLWQDRPCATEGTAPNNLLDGHGELASHHGSPDDSNVSKAYSKGVMDTLTQALRLSGVDLSRTNISVQIDVSKRSNGGVTSLASSAKENRYPENQVTAQTGARSFVEDSDPACKRQRTERS